MNNLPKDGQIKMERIELSFQKNVKLCQNKVNNSPGKD